MTEEHHSKPTHAEHEAHEHGGHEKHEHAAHEGHEKKEHAAHETKEHAESPKKAQAAPAKKHHVKHAAKPKAEKAEHPRPHHAVRKPKKKINWAAVAVGAVALLIIAYLLFRGTGAPPAEPLPKGEAGQYGTAKLDFYVMSQCPYGTQVEDGVAPVLKELGSNVDFTLNFIAADGGNGNFQSLHGPAEVYGDKLHLCVQEHYPDQLMDFVTCQNKKYQDLVGTIDSCAQEAGIDGAKVKECADGEEGNQLLSASIKASQAVQAQGSPTMYLDGQLYQGGRDAASFKRAICAKLKGHPNCADMPACSSDADCTGEPGKVGTCENPGKKDSKCTYVADAEVTLTVVNAAGCAECDPTELLNVLEKVFLNMEVEQVEASTPEGKQMVKKYGLEKAPSFIFSGALKDTSAWSKNQRIQGAFRPVGEDYVMLDQASGASYVIDEQKRKEMEAKIGVTKGDNKPQIDFYVMSYCPYGNMAEEGIEPVYRLLQDKAEFNAHFVLYSNYASGYPTYCLDEGNKYCSMHGVQELNQDLRELCVQKYMGTGKMFDFMLAMNKKCSASNADTCWEAVAKDLGLDTAKIKKCEKDEGLAMAAAELELNQLLSVKGSPTVFVEGNPYGGGRDPASYAAALCAAFEDAPSECDDLSAFGSAPAAAAPAGGCG